MVLNFKVSTNMQGYQVFEKVNVSFYKTLFFTLSKGQKVRLNKDIGSLRNYFN